MKKLFTLSFLFILFSTLVSTLGWAQDGTNTGTNSVTVERSEYPANQREPAATSSSVRPPLVSEIQRTPAQIEQDKEVMEKAKARRYKGGAEEGELRAQAQLPKAQRKIAPVVDRTETDKESQDHD